MKLIKITASWCMSCIIMNEVLKDIEDNYNKKYESISLDYDTDSQEYEKYNIGNILPVYIKLDDNDKEIDRIVGEHSKKEIVKFLKDGGYIDD